MNVWATLMLSFKTNPVVRYSKNLYIKQKYKIKAMMRNNIASKLVIYFDIPIFFPAACLLKTEHQHYNLQIEF